MGFIVIGIIIYAAVELAKGCRERARQREILRIKAEQSRAAQERSAMAKREIEMKREQERIAKETARLAKEQEKQAAQLAKHEERLLRIEQKLELARAEEEYQIDKVCDIKIDIAGIEAFVNYMTDRGLPCTEKEKELAKAKEKLHSAEMKLLKARQAREMAEKQREAA